ncbi:MAG TPA: hypothetical protein VJ508_08770, partial [Saprospiraceae bacterium]|nr:hypothetical protein [Saprospiraceae bacterium]
MFSLLNSKTTLFLSVLILSMAACKPDHKKPEGLVEKENTAMDMHSHARPDAVIRHLSLDLSVDFVTKQLSGTATYDIEVKPGADTIYLDARNLEIGKIYVDDQDTPYRLGADEPYIGSALAIPV